MKSSVAAFTILFLLHLEIKAQGPQGCTFDITDLYAPQPIILTAYTHNFIYPTGFDNFDPRVTIRRGELILIACPRGTLVNFSSSLVYAACNNLDQLIVNGSAIHFASLACDNSDIGTLRSTNQTCGIDSNSRTVEIGLDISAGTSFIPLVTVCFDFIRRTAVYANFTMSGALGLGRFHYMGPIPEDLTVFNLTVPVSSLYDLNTARSTINAQLGLDLNSERYIKKQFRQELLVRPEEHFYDAQARAVYRNVITWPQWRDCYYNKEVRSGLYMYVRQYVVSNRIDLQVYTGTYGTASLPHEQTGKPTEIYMYNEGNVKAIPVPAMLWRLVYEPQTKRAVVLIDIGNTNITNVHDLVVCNDVSEYIDWAHFSDSCGLTYACSYADFKKAVPYLPQLNVTDLLVS